MAASGRRRSWRMRGGAKMTGAGGADLLKPHGGRSGKSGSCGLMKHAGATGTIGHIVKPSTAQSVVKPSPADSGEEAWIYVRGCRIQRAGLRFNSQGEVYVPDSEDEEEALEVSATGAVGVYLAPAVTADGAAGVDLVPAVAADGAVGVDLAPAVATEGAVGVDLAPVVAADGAVGVEMKPKVAARLAKKVLGEDLHPEVATLLAEVLSKMEPLYHECFIGMYKAELGANAMLAVSIAA